jgi:hypothetical protein
MVKYRGYSFNKKEEDDGFQLCYQSSGDTSGLTGSYEQFPSETRLLM